MTCNDIIQIKELSGLKLVAGSAGLSHNVRWIYFSESSTHVNDIKTLGNWVSGGELFVCTNEKILEDKNLIINMIKNANELGAAGIILNVGSIEAEYIELAEKFSLPLFEIPWSIRLVDLSQIICTHLIREQKEENSFERLLSSVIFTHFDSEDDIILNCKYYGFDLTKKNRIAIFKIVDNTDFKTKKEDKKSKIRSYFQRCIKNGFRDAGVKKIMSLLQYNMVTVLFPDDMFSGQSFESMVDIIALHLKYSHPDIDFHVGVGNVCSGANGAKRSYSEAEKALKLINVVSGRQTVFFEELGIYALLFNIEDISAFELFYNRELGKLIEHDKLNGSQLCKTLEVYFEKNKIIGKTADALYIHRNTLRYRLDKIQSLLGKDFDEVDNLVNINMAFKIKNYMDVFWAATDNES